MGYSIIFTNKIDLLKKLISQSILGFLSSTDPYYNINRYVAPAIFGILTFEILKFFNEILLSISGGSDDGVLIILLKRIVVVSLIG